MKPHPPTVVICEGCPACDDAEAKYDEINRALQVAEARGLHESDTDSTVDRRKRRRATVCDLDPPHRGENAPRRAKHGAQKRKRSKRG